MRGIYKKIFIMWTELSLSRTIILHHDFCVDSFKPLGCNMCELTDIVKVIL